ncbi:probable disease resistance protein At4g27220 [Camellia sinensis]|uniref:probable disease resistance protein At4g27220 n=1 Tax=Camellia sinensis TaxID=4442 RepID=UPI001035B724|nr:probable disease resistance protein At4g27220 [Camellia sinensis]
MEKMIEGQALWMGDLNATVQHIFGERKASKITELTKSNFDTVSYRVSLLEIESSLAINKFAAFESRKSMVKEIMKALDDDNINVIGGCGMGGVGKTTIVKKVCRQAKAEKKFDMFAMVVMSQTPKGTAGEIVDSKDLNAIAREVWRECGGLPIAIVTVGRALMKNPSKDVWIDAARQLQNPVRTKIKGMESYVYSSLELSYNYLESEEKPCFLLCSLFPKDNDIPKEALVRYGIGLGLFQEVDTTEDAGHRALAIVSTLVSSFMLLEVYGKIKMHDVVRYFAIHIACKEENKHIVKAGIGLTDWPDNHTTFQNYTGISFMDNHICELPSGLEFSKLEILLLQWNSRRFEIMQIPNNFSEGMKDLKVLDMSSNIPNAHMFPDDLRFEELVSVDIRTGKRGCVCQESFEKTLRLTYEDCEGLKNILEDLDSDSFDQLKSLKLEECNETKYLLDMIDGAPRVLAPFCNLEELELWHLGNFSEICHGQLSAASFSYLRSVRFTSSGPLKLLFPPSLVQGLVHLQSLSCFCRNLEEIFPMQEKEQIGKSLSTSTNLQNLTHVTVHYSDRLRNIFSLTIAKVHLQDLGSLTCFFTGGYAVEYPSLEQMLMRGCCKMKTFGRGVLMTPNLKKVHVRVDRHGQIIRNDRGIWKGDLNATVQHIFNESVTVVNQMK